MNICKVKNKIITYQGCEVLLLLNPLQLAVYTQTTICVNSVAHMLAFLSSFRVCKFENPLLHIKSPSSVSALHFTIH